MTKRQLIDQIVSLNQSAGAEFLAQFPDQDLDEYLRHLTAARMPRPWRWRGSSPAYAQDLSPRHESSGATCTIDRCDAESSDAGSDRRGRYSSTSSGRLF